MSRPRITVTSEDDNGRNQFFHDNYKGNDMTREQFVNEIKVGNYTHYHVRNINGIDTPCSNPDKSQNNNLG